MAIGGYPGGGLWAGAGSPDVSGSTGMPRTSGPSRAVEGEVVDASISAR